MRTALILFLLFSTLLLLVSKPVLAEDCPNGTDPSSKCWSSEAQATHTLNGIMVGGLYILSGVDGADPSKKLPSYDRSGKVKLFSYAPNGGAIGSLSNAIVAMYNPPTSTREYLASVGQSLGIASPAYAQSSVPGSGNGIIKPVLQMWQVMRNLAYLLFTLIFLVVGFMIMFRRKLNPQTVTNIQNALPGLVIGLILVTFSYFLAALMIDLTFVAMQLLGQVFAQAANTFDPQALANKSNVFDLFTSSAFR